MITRDQQTRNITVTPEDIPALRGLILSAREHLVEDSDDGAKIPGSFLHIYQAFLDAADRFEAAADQ